jgi:hypothetical protein
MKTSLQSRLEVRPNPEFDRKFFYAAYGLLILLILCFTYLHHVQPQILRVPNPADVASWQNPSFQHTCIYDRMTDEERSRILSQGVPGNTVPELLFNEIFLLVVGLSVFWHVRKHYGSWMANCFLIGSFVFTGLQESIWILFGRFTGTSASQGIGEQVFGTYWFTRGLLWFIETPVFVCLGWFIWAYAAVWVAGKLFPRMGLLGRAAIGALIPMSQDLWIDPVATSPENMSWVWAKGDCLLVLGIPQSNFVGWFALIFVFAILWEQLPKWELRWGRLKTTLFFFFTLIVGEIAILAFLFPWCYALKQFLLLAGVQHGVRLPAGW